MSDWIIRLIGEGGYLGIFALMLLETVFPPVPSEVIMTVAGMHAGQGKLALPMVIMSGTAGAMVGNWIWYILARAVGLVRFKPFIERHGRWLTLDWPSVESGRVLFERFGPMFMAVGRVLPTIRSLISIPGGLVAMPQWRFLLWSTLGTMCWTGALATAGWFLGNRFADAEKVLGPLSILVIALIIGSYLWRLATWSPATSVDSKAAK